MYLFAENNENENSVFLSVFFPYYPLLTIIISRGNQKQQQEEQTT
jgi:hypothetical protein